MNKEQLIKNAKPLKNKPIEICLDTDMKDIKKRVKQTDRYYPEKEVISAVIWLKREIMDNSISKDNPKYELYIKELVNTAFEKAIKSISIESFK